MKRLLSFLLISTFLFNPASVAATKKPVVKSLQLLANIGSSEEFAGLVTSGKTIVVFGNKGDKSFAKALDASGKELWNIALDNASPSVATAGAVDSSGNIWIAGSTSLQRPIATASPTASPLNPDKITLVPDIFTTELNAFSLWSINPTNLALAQYSLQLDSPVLINSIGVDKAAITSVGSSGALITSDLSGKIQKPIFIGTGATNFESLVKQSDGSITIVGSSTETIGGKKLAGKVDGVILKLSKAGNLISVVRSSAPKAARNWNSLTSTFLLGGAVVTGSKIESAITKFSNTYTPQWTYRFTSSGPTFTSGSTYALIQSTASIKELSNWSPKAPQPLLLAFDSKGLIAGAYSAPAEQKEVLGLYNSKELGLLCITSSAESVSIFTLK